MIRDWRLGRKYGRQQQNGFSLLAEQEFLPRDLFNVLVGPKVQELSLELDFFLFEISDVLFNPLDPLLLLPKLQEISGEAVDNQQTDDDDGTLIELTAHVLILSTHDSIRHPQPLSE